MATFEVNRVMLLGNLTQDPETRYLPSGMAVTKLRLAANRRFKDRSGEQREESLFINVEAWGRQAETCQEYLRKGSEALVEGRLKMDSYQAQDGQNRTVYVIVADRVQFGRRPGQGGPGGYSDESGGYDSGGGHNPSPDQSVSSPPGGNYRQSAASPRGAGQHSSSPRQSQSPTWQSEPSTSGFPESEDAPPDDFGDEAGGTDNDLPF